MKHMLGESQTEQENFRGRLMEKPGIKTTGPAQKTGSLQMVCSSHGKTFKIGVVLTVYGGSGCFEHYAVVSHEGKISRHAGFINLKQCKVKAVDSDSCSFIIYHKDCDGNMLTFIAKTTEATESWLEVLNSKSDSKKRHPLGSLSFSNCQTSQRMTVPRDVCMPTLCEEEEE